MVSMMWACGFSPFPPWKAISATIPTPSTTGDLTATVSGDGIDGGSDTVQIISTSEPPITISYDMPEYIFAEDATDEAVYAVVTLDAAYPRAPSNGSTMVGRPRPLPPLALHVNPVGRPETDLRVWPVAALVLVADPATWTRIDPDVAAEALGLTGMESRVAVLLAEGMTVREIAAATGRGESTIRTHVKHMFGKHNLSRQAELVRLVLALGPLRSPGTDGGSRRGSAPTSSALP